LQRDVLDAEAPAQQVLQFVKRPVPASEVAHDHMRRERDPAPRQRPDVQVMHGVDRFVPGHLHADGFRRQPQGHAFHKRVHAFA